MVVAQETIIDVIKRTGPLLPAKLAKAIGTNILIASAHLSDLVDRKKVLISNTKVGGSPVYYVQGQEQRLQEFVPNLNDKDQNTFNLLKSKRVLRDDKMDQLTRLSLRTIKDFAVPLQVIKNNEKFLFWKWYLISNQEAEELIKKELEIKQEPRKLEKLKEEKPVEKEIKKVEQKKLEKPDQKHIEEKRKIEEERKKIDEERKKLQEERKQLKKQLELERQTMLKEIETQKKQVKKEEPAEKVETDEFFKLLMGFFKEKKIELVKHKIVRKHAEIDMVLKIPSVVGEIEYYCKAKNKKNVTDSDLSSAYVQGQLKKLPVLFLTTGELNKKAKELLNTELNKGLVIKKV